MAEWNETKDNPRGSWSSGNTARSFRRSFVADANGLVAGAAAVGSSGLINTVAGIFGADTPPNMMTVSVKDSDGLDIIPPITFTASGRVAIVPPQQFVNGCNISIADNTTPGATGTVVLYA